MPLGDGRTQATSPFLPGYDFCPAAKGKGDPSKRVPYDAIACNAPNITFR